jgi:hypothetical protein
MFTKTTFALGFALAASSGALAATKQQSVAPFPNLYDARGTYVGADPDAKLLSPNVRDSHGTYVGADPDAKVRFELRRDSDRGYK